VLIFIVGVASDAGGMEMQEAALKTQSKSNFHLGGYFGSISSDQLHGCLFCRVRFSPSIISRLLMNVAHF
jgi:hypothetical protein